MTLEQIGGWLAWMQRQPRGFRRLDQWLTILRHDLRSPHVEHAESYEDLLPSFANEGAEPVDEETQELIDTFFRPVRF